MVGNLNSGHTYFITAIFTQQVYYQPRKEGFQISQKHSFQCQCQTFGINVFEVELSLDNLKNTIWPSRFGTQKNV